MSDVDPARCPLCQADNRCGQLSGAAPCWCTKLAISRETLAAIPAEAKRVACVCEACVRKGGAVVKASGR